MNIIHTFLALLFFSSALHADENSLIEIRLNQIETMKTKEIKEWPEKAGLLFQGFHYKLKKPVKTRKDHLAAIALIPKVLLDGHYKPQKTIEKNGWYITNVGFSIIASKVGESKLHFGYQW